MSELFFFFSSHDGTVFFGGLIEIQVILCTLKDPEGSSCVVILELLKKMKTKTWFCSSHRNCLVGHFHFCFDPFFLYIFIPIII